MSQRWIAFFAAVGFFAGLGLSSCSGGARCMPSNCSGCCTMYGECLEGRTVKACGSRGDLCDDCGSAGTCANQQCVVYVADGGDEHPEGNGGASGVDGGRVVDGGFAGAGGSGGSGGGTAGGGTAGGATAGGGTAGGATAGGGTAGGATAGGGTAGGTAGGATAGGGAAGGATAGGGTAGGIAPGGVLGQYFSNTLVNTVVPVTRTDPNIDFDWGTAAPIAGVPADGFMVRWTGRVQPQFNETYTFYVSSDDGCRLWVNGQTLIDKWVNQSVTESTGTITLLAGQLYDLRLDYFDGASSAVARLSWSSPSQTKQIIPPSRLFAPVTVSGGLWGDYYVYENLSGYFGHRDNGPIDYVWTGTGPGNGFPYNDFYSVRWTGTVLPPTTGTYTFYTQSDDGVLLWVNGVLLVDNWTEHGSTENSGTISLTAGQRAIVRLDYQQIEGDAIIRLSWTPPGGAKQVIPASALAR